ncbi:MAG: HD domain-containing protein [Promethearchaeota archaeon]
MVEDKGEIYVEQKGYIPTKKETLDTLNRMGLPKPIIHHVLAVARKAVRIATKIQSVPVDLRLVRIGAILHDIGRVRSHDFDHAVIGGEIIRKELRWSEKLARIAETHILGGITKEEAKILGLPEKDFMPHTIEEKIVCLADKYIIGSKKVSIELRFRNWINRFGETELLFKAKKRVEELELTIYKLMYP